MTSFLDKLRSNLPQLEGGLKRGELTTIAAPAVNPRVGERIHESFLRNYKLENIGYQISDDPAIHQRIREDGIRMNRGQYDFLAGSADLYPYYMHNLLRDCFGVEKLYDYDETPVTKINAPDLPTAVKCIDNFKFILASQTIKALNYKITKTIVTKHGKSEVIVELIIND